MVEPAPKSAALVAEIEGYRAAGGADEIRLRRIKNQIDSIKDADPARAFMLHGMLACLRDQPDSMIECHEKSRWLAPADLTLCGNYLSSLVVTGYIDEAEKLAQELYEQFGEDARKDYFTAKLAAGRIHEALSLMPHGALEPDELYHGRLDEDDVRRWAKLFDSFQISDEAGHDALCGVYGQMHAMGYYFHDITIDLATDGGDEWLSVVLRPARARSLDAIQNLNDRLTEQQAERDWDAFRTGAMIARFSRPRDSDSAN